MAVGPIGNAIYVNQQMASVASEKNAMHNRFQLQNIAAATATNKKEEEVLEVRPAEENQKIDPDREHDKQQAEQETEREQREEEEEQEETQPPLHRLDIKV